MRVLIVTAGSRGDVAPFTGLGQRLQQAGHQVALAAHDRFADLVRECGLEHRALPGDPVELVRARTAAPSPEAAKSVFAGFLDELGDGVIAAVAAGTDVLLTASGPAPLSRLVADGFGIPSLGVYLAPGVPTREFPPPGLPVTGQLSPADNIAAGRELLARTGSLYADVLRRLRTRLGLRTAATEASSAADDWPICHGYSPEVVPRPADWPATVHVTGYWWPARPPGWQPPDPLVDFLGAGPPPVFIGFGSMTPHHERLHDVVAAAVERAGVRASSSPAGPDSRPRETTSCWSATCRTTGCSSGRPPWSTTPARAPPGPGSAREYRRFPCPSWSTSPSGRTGCTASASRRGRCPCTS
ncbi:glycosyltransferase [Pseudonocardia sp. DSM 45834]|uniref:Glycosyltransferase n=1 Tax=Pseudonocardia charpentierae TaxID=3075545 RepID=A0ABU2N680_9PSEU|nr:glycosyltransferase [Pseudonocardia sp. DSM 45834]MDT0349062.1 glycosyltransferase [Pseudonocardia sp. DSM 45834]